MIKTGRESGKPRAQMLSLSSCSTHSPPPTTTRPPISALERQIQPYLFGHLHTCKKKSAGASFSFQLEQPGGKPEEVTNLF